MQVTVHYLAQMKRAAGCVSEAIETPPHFTLRDFVRHLANIHGPVFGDMILDEVGEPRASLLFFVGDEHAEHNRPLRNGDVVTILAPMAGG